MANGLQRGAHISDRALVVTCAEFATLVACPSQQVRDWCNREHDALPSFDDRPPSKTKRQICVDLKYAIPWWHRNIAVPGRKNKADSDERLAKAKADKAEFEVEQARREVVPTVWATNALAEIIAPCSMQLEQIKNLAPRLVHKDAIEIREILGEAVYALKNELSSTDFGEAILAEDPERSLEPDPEVHA